MSFDTGYRNNKRSARKSSALIYMKKLREWLVAGGCTAGVTIPAYATKKVSTRVGMIMSLLPFRALYDTEY